MERDGAIRDSVGRDVIRWDWAGWADREEREWNMTIRDETERDRT